MSSSVLKSLLRLLFPVSVLLIGCVAETSATAADLRLLFLGDNGHHRPENRFQELTPALEQRGITLQYTDRMTDLNPDVLKNYDGLVLYANIDRIEDAQADAVLDFVKNGGGFVPLHCATYCWRNNNDMTALMGAQFQRHGGQIFTTQIAEPGHPVMKGYGSFTSWDETYIHHRHNEKNRTVLEYRVEGEQADGNKREPWTWVRTHGRGRVFYTAWGHDQRTFSHPGFHNLVERGIRWACGDDPGQVPSFSDPQTFTVPEMTSLPDSDSPPFEYTDVGPKIPNYTPGTKWGVQGKPRNLMQNPLSAEKSIRRFVTPKGMAVRLYADERSFQAKPIAMTWDERGRLWVCETVDYPNELGGNRDRIRICEDTDGDHVADRFTVFADGLSIPTAIVTVRGGAVVQNGTETIYLKDTSGDDVADQKTTLIANWKLGDTHGGVSNFRYGLDNWIWAMQGYNNSTPKVDGLPPQTFRMGFWRFRLSQTDPPKVTDLEFIRSSNNNTWGLGISEEGLIFGSTANRNPGMFVPIPNRYYERVRGWSPQTLGSIADNHLFDPVTDNVRQVDQFGGYTAGAGHALYTARTFPQQWWNKTAFVCGPTGHLVGTFVLRRDGAGYTSSSPCNLLASDDEWSAPIMAEVGPDGAVWVIDWYNYIVQHNPTPQGFETGKGNAYESDLRDKKHGRIYRVVPLVSREKTSEPRAEKSSEQQRRVSERQLESREDMATSGEQGELLHSFESLADLSDKQLVDVLRHPSMTWRLQAQRLLVERQPQNILEDLISLVDDQSVDEIGLNVGAIHALHTLHGIGYISFDPKLLYSGPMTGCLNRAVLHPSGAVRQNAVAVLPTDEFGRDFLLKHSFLFDDSDAQVRLHAVLKLADMPSSETAGKTVAQLASQADDPIVTDALTSAAAVHAESYLRSLADIQQSSMSDVSLQIAGRVAEHIARGRPDAHRLRQVIRELSDENAKLANTVLDGLTRGIPVKFEFRTTNAFDEALVAAFKKADSDSQNKLVRLASQCNTDALNSYAAEILQAMLDVVGDSDADDDDRVSAARDLIGFRPDDSDTVTEIVSQINARTTPKLGRQLLQAVRLSRSADAGQAIVDVLPALTPQLRSDALGTLLSRPDWVKTLLAGLESQNVSLNDLSLDQKQALRSFPDREIREQAEKLLSMSGGLPDANRDRVLKSLHHLTEREGSVDVGREMFKKHCSKCHIHGDTGKAIGPNLTGMAVHPKEELLTHIIDPSRSVEGNFRIYTVVMTDGRVTSGMLASETRTSITLIDTEAKETGIPRDDIEELLASKKSLMPEGFEKQMTEKELSGLLQFLTNKGRYVPIRLDRYATAISTKGLFGGGDSGPDRMVFSDWAPKTYKGVPFLLTDPLGQSKPNIILLNGPRSTLPPQMPKSVELPCNAAVKSIHLLSGVGGWNFPFDRSNTVSMIVRMHYESGETEDHKLINGVHFADYIRRVDVPESEFAFALGNQQIRYLSVSPRKSKQVRTIELVKGPDGSAPIVMAVTIETGSVGDEGR